MDQADIDDWGRVVSIALSKESGQVVPVSADLLIAVDECLVRGDVSGRFLAGLVTGLSVGVILILAAAIFAVVHGWTP